MERSDVVAHRPSEEIILVRKGARDAELELKGKAGYEKKSQVHSHGYWSRTRLQS